MEERQELTVVGLSHSSSMAGCFVLVLEALNTQQRLPIIIGEAEAQAIAITMEGMQSPQPITHDLLKNIIDELGAKLKEVVIYEMQQDVFHTQLIVQTREKEQLVIPARCSDAVALAVRAQTPIYSFDSILSLATIDRSFTPEKVKRGSLQAYSVQELQEILERLLTKEDYKSAARIRDLIEKRKPGA
ncbi:MAG: bifunctional nuclease family protein [Bacteroidota bacterium]